MSIADPLPLGAQSFFAKDTPDRIDPISIAYEYGRGESGEIVCIYKDDSVLPDYEVYWDARRRAYRSA